MSSLAASRADNFYYPPEWTPDKGSISKFQGSKGKNQYEHYGIIRFELPFDAWCLKCERHMSKGLRFNAKKDRAGKYFTTTIWAFTTKCYSCDQQFVIKTDPKNNTYEFAEGLRKHEQDYEIGRAEGVVEFLSDEQKGMLEKDPMFKLQHVQEDKIRSKSEREHLFELQELQEATAKSDYDMNALLRKKNREVKKKDLRRQEDGRALGLAIPLLDSSEADKALAQQASFRLKRKDPFQESETQRRLQVQTQSIFKQSNSKKRPSSSSTSSIDPKTIRNLVSNSKVDVNSFSIQSKDDNKSRNLQVPIVVKKRKVVESSSDPPQVDQKREDELTTTAEPSANDDVFSLLAEY